MTTIKKYKLELISDLSGNVFVMAKSKKEAVKKGNKILEESTRPDWWEWGSEDVKIVGIFKKI